MSKPTDIINKEEFSFLPTILSIFEKIESNETEEIKKISLNLFESIENCKNKINKLPGIENSNIEQLNKYDEEIKVVNQRRKQFIHYLNMPIFKKFYNEADIKKQTELASIQEKLEEKDKEIIKEIKKRNNVDDDPMDIEIASKKIKTESATDVKTEIKKEN